MGFQSLEKFWWLGNGTIISDGNWTPDYPSPLAPFPDVVIIAAISLLYTLCSWRKEFERDTDLSMVIFQRSSTSMVFFEHGNR